MKSVRWIAVAFVTWMAGCGDVSDPPENLIAFRQQRNECERRARSTEVDCLLNCSGADGGGAGQAHAVCCNVCKANRKYAEDTCNGF